MKLVLSIFIFLCLCSGNILAQSFVVDSILISGNKKTKDQIILRELMFSKGDTLDLHEWNFIKTKSEQNLINISVFHSVNIELEGDNFHKKIFLTVTERWYLWPIPQIDIEERNFNSWLETKDFSRASAGVLLRHNNMRGRNELMELLLMLGYNMKLGFFYEFPSINKKRTIGLGLSSYYTTSHEVNAMTLNDKQVYLKTEDELIQRDWVSALQVHFRPGYNTTHFFQVQYHEWNFADTLLKFNPYYSVNDNTRLNYIGLYYKMKYDLRDYRPYPLKGVYADIEVFKHGLGIINKDIEVFSIKTTMRCYDRLFGKFYWGLGIIAKTSWSDFNPYYLERGLGFGRDFVRGYEYYVVDGQNYAVFKSNVKYALFQKKVLKFDYISAPKFNRVPLSVYINFFADAGYVKNNQVYDESNILPNSLLHSFGLGIDVSTYYDVVTRVEFAVNKQGEFGIYYHFIAPL